MKKFLCVVYGMASLWALTGGSAFAASEQEIGQMEDRRYAALEKNDFVTLEDILADEMSYTHASAIVDDKASYLAALKSGAVKIKKVERAERKIHVYGDAATVIGEARFYVTVKGEDRVVHLRYSDVWIKKDKGWQFVMWESTPIPEPK